MTTNFVCGDEARLVEYLYDECDEVTRAVVAAHVRSCPRCAEDLALLQTTRGTLASWTPPVVPLGFRIVSDAEAPVQASVKVLRPARWWRKPLPAWGQAAAAVLIFGAGVGLGALRGITQQSGAVTTVATGRAGAEAASVSTQDLAALEQRLRAEMQQMRPVASTSSSAPSNVATLPQVRALIAESEQRQQRELTLRTAEVIRDFDIQRRGDLARIQQTFGRFEGITGAEVEQQRQMLNYLMRVSQRGNQP